MSSLELKYLFKDPKKLDRNGLPDYTSLDFVSNGSLNVNGRSFTSAQVTSEIQAGNRAYTTASSGELSQADMDTLLAYAASKNISIIIY